MNSIREAGSRVEGSYVSLGHQSDLEAGEYCSIGTGSDIFSLLRLLEARLSFWVWKVQSTCRARLVEEGLEAFEEDQKKLDVITNDVLKKVLSAPRGSRILLENV